MELLECPGGPYQSFLPGSFDRSLIPPSGLTYTPGMYASTSELAVLCRILAEEFPGAFYAPHHRSYGLNAIESYSEMLDLGRSTRCPVREFGCLLSCRYFMGISRLTRCTSFHPSHH